MKAGGIAVVFVLLFLMGSRYTQDYALPLASLFGMTLFMYGAQQTWSPDPE